MDIQMERPHIAANVRKMENSTFCCCCICVGACGTCGDDLLERTLFTVLGLVFLPVSRSSVPAIAVARAIFCASCAATRAACLAKFFAASLKPEKLLGVD